MTIKSDLQYYADTEFLYKLALIERGLTKQAGILEDYITPVLSGATSALGSVISGFTDAIKSGNPMVIMSKVIELLEGPIIMAINPVLFFINEAFSMFFHFSAKDLFIAIIKSVYDMVKQGKPITTDTVNNIGLSLVGPLNSEASSDLLGEWRNYSDNGMLLMMLKEAGLISTVMNPFVKLFAAGPIKKVGGKLLAGIVIWLAKTLLKGVGLLTISTAVKGLIGGGKGQQAMQQQEDKKDDSVSLPPIISHSYKSSGFGEIQHTNNDETAWYVHIDNDVKQTLTQKEALKNAPKKDSDYFKVPKVIDQH